MVGRPPMAAGRSNQAVDCLLYCFLLAVWIGCEVGGVSAHTTTLQTPALSPFQGNMILVEKDNILESGSALTARTERIDPLDHLKKYRGGYNITNMHYFSSTIFTGKYGFGIAALWLLGGLVYGGILLIITICFNKKERKVSKRPLSFKRDRLWPILIGVVLTLLAIVASGVVLGSSSRFHFRANSVKNIIVETAQEATGTLYKVSKAVTALKEDIELYGDPAGSRRLKVTAHILSDAADNIQSKAEKSMHLINMGLKILEVVTIVITVLSLVIVLALLVSATLRLRRVFHLLIIISWLLTTLFWISFGLYFFVDKFAGDTCVALDEYQQNPQNSSLGSIIPCNNQLAARVIHDTKVGMYKLIEQVNPYIQAGRSMFPDLANVCNPISGPPDYNYQPENCTSNTKTIGDIPLALKRYSCLGGDGKACEPGEFIPASIYNRLLVGASSIQNILNAIPVMEGLIDCQMVKDAFSKILFQQCKQLNKSLHMTWAALAALSAIMVALVLTWILEAHLDNKSCSSDGSVNPHLTSMDVSRDDSTEKDDKIIEIKVES